MGKKDTTLEYTQEAISDFCERLIIQLNDKDSMVFISLKQKNIII